MIKYYDMSKQELLVPLTKLVRDKEIYPFIDPKTKLIDFPKRYIDLRDITSKLGAWKSFATPADLRSLAEDPLYIAKVIETFTKMSDPDSEVYNFEHGFIGYSSSREAPFKNLDYTPVFVGQRASINLDVQFSQFKVQNGLNSAHMLVRFHTHPSWFLEAIGFFKSTIGNTLVRFSNQDLKIIARDASINPRFIECVGMRIGKGKAKVLMVAPSSSQIDISSSPETISKITSSAMTAESLLEAYSSIGLTAYEAVYDDEKLSELDEERMRKESAKIQQLLAYGYSNLDHYKEGWGNNIPKINYHKKILPLNNKLINFL